MGRLRLGAITACTLALAGPAGAAEITRVASRGEPGNAFDLHVTMRWDRFQERARITRERPLDDGTGAVEDGDELRYSRVQNAVVPRVAVGITRNLDVHFEWPYVLADDRTWRFGLFRGVPTGGVPGLPRSSIEENTIDANGDPCPSAPVPCPLFPVAPTTTVYHGGRAGDLKGGVAWGIFDDRRDATKPFWLVGVDVTFPTASLYDPARGREANWASPNDEPGKPGPFGEKIWKWDFYTAMSRRLGAVEPYVRAHATVMSQSSSTYTNCDHAAELAARGEMSDAAVAGCADSRISQDADAELPWVAGLTFGTELVPYENAAEQQKVSVDLRLFGDYTSSQRFYNELTDASGKLHRTEEHLTVGGFVGLYLRASRYVSLHATASLATSTPHFITGESPADGNPNYDARYDAPGRRFRVSEVALFQLSFGGVLTF